MTPDEIIKRAEALGPWYHEIELAPGYITKSCMLPYSKPAWDGIRTMLARADYKDKTVLDLGTMDGLWAFEAARRGSKNVIATDIYQSERSTPEYKQKIADRFMFARGVLGFQNVVHYWEGGDVMDIQPWWKTHMRTADIVHCLGILYHVTDPLRALMQLRSVVQPNASPYRILLETAIWDTFTGPIMRFNPVDKAIYNDTTTFWVPNWGCFQQMLDVAKLRVVGEPVIAKQVHANRVCLWLEPV